MENNNTNPLFSTPGSQDFDNVVTSLQNLDLDNVVCDDSSRMYDHGAFDGSQYSAYSPQLRYVDWSSSVQRPQVLDHTSSWARHGNGENLYSQLPAALRTSVHTSTFLEDERMRNNPFSGCSGMYSGMYNVANQLPGLTMPRDSALLYDPSYLGGYTMSRNGYYYNQGLTQTRSYGQNGYHNQGSTEKRSNVLNGYCNQGFTEKRSNVLNGYCNQGSTEKRSNVLNGYCNQGSTEKWSNVLNGYCNQGSTEKRSDVLNGYCNQGSTEKRSNVVNGYCNQDSTNAKSVQSMAFLSNPQDIVSMAMEKEGSMSLQNLLLEGNQKLKTTILEAVLDHIHQLLVNQFGHHMIDKLVESCGDFELQKILEKLASEPELLATAARSKEGSSSLQKLIKHLKKSPHSLCLTSALAPKVVDLATHKTSRHVFRECLNLLDSQAKGVLYEEAIKNFDTLARDEVGCLALNDCIDFAPNDAERKRITQLVIDNAVSLACDPYGNYIVQNAVKIPDCSHQICKNLRGHYIYLSTKKSGSHVVEKCIESCSSAVMHAIEEILEKKQAIELARNEYGNYVIQTALHTTQWQNSNIPIQLRNSLAKALLPGMESLKNTKAGKKLANSILKHGY